MKVATLIQLLSGVDENANVSISLEHPDFETATSFEVVEMKGSAKVEVILGRRFGQNVPKNRSQKTTP